jgi:hypothetical protein
MDFQNLPTAKSKDERQAEVKAEQSGLSRDEIREDMERRAEYVLDLDNLPKQTHNWVQRGAKVSCEGANHPHHSHFLTQR